MRRDPPSHPHHARRQASELALGLPLVGVALAVAVTVGGCAKDRDPIEANAVLESGDAMASVEWEPEDRDRAIAAMREALDGTPADRPAPAAHGRRWSDVPAAAYWGAVAVEMAIVTTTSDETSMRFELVTVRDEPATLVVERVEPPECVRVTATVGSFGQHTETAKRLEEEFLIALEKFGLKPGFE